MPTVITPRMLLDDCNAIVSAVAPYSANAHACLSVLLTTGAREGESLDRARWSLGSFETWNLAPQKGNPVRSIPQGDLHHRFLEWLGSGGYPYKLSSLMNLRRVVDQFSAYPLMYTGNKQISTHRFRHNMIKQLSLAGASTPDIKVIMGLSATSTVEGYVNSVLLIP